jgi:hypothetical protein
VLRERTDLRARLWQQRQEERAEQERRAEQDAARRRAVLEQIAARVRVDVEACVFLFVSRVSRDADGWRQ